MVAVVPIIFTVDSFRRLNKCLEQHDHLGITKISVRTTISVLIAAALAILLLEVSVAMADTNQASSSIPAETSTIKYMFICDCLSFVVLVIASMPIVYVVNTLLNLTVEDSDVEQKAKALKDFNDEMKML